MDDSVRVRRLPWSPHVSNPVSPGKRLAGFGGKRSLRIRTFCSRRSESGKGAKNRATARRTASEKNSSSRHSPLSERLGQASTFWSRRSREAEARESLNERRKYSAEKSLALFFFAEFFRRPFRLSLTLLSAPGSPRERVWE